LKSRRAALKLREERRTYDQWVNGAIFAPSISGARSKSHKSLNNRNDDESMAQQLRSINDSIGIILNIILSIGAMFGIGYYIGYKVRR